LKLIEKIKYRINFKLNGILKIRKSIKNYFKYSDTLFLVYSMGKTGSSSIYYTLMRDLPFNKVLHVHFLSSYWYEWFSSKASKRNKKERNQILSDKAKKYISDKGKVMTISIIRDPFSRSISDYFHSNKNFISEKTDTDIKNEISNSFYIQTNSLEWFEKDFNSYFKFDIYQKAFNKEKGWEIYDLDSKNRVLLIRIDVLTQSFKTAFLSLTGININELFITNRREDDDMLSDRYKSFKANYGEERSSVDEKLNSKFVKHFFTDEQIEKLRAKYTAT